MNISEKKVKDIYEKFGWDVIRGGAPDFLLIKKEGNKITDVMFCEVKTDKHQKLQKNQKIYKYVLENIFNANYELLVVDNYRKCNVCGKELIYSFGRPPKYCKNCAKDIKKKKDFKAKQKNEYNSPLSDDEFKLYNEAYSRPDLIKYKTTYFYDNYKQCPICNYEDHDFDTKNGEILCKNCGLVLGELLF